MGLSGKQADSVYFPNLNGIRFIAAFSVMIHHIEQVKYVFGIEGHLYSFHLVKNMGRLGVGLFFVLSGFLITYLLLHEKGRFGRISAPDFYIRRVLRIWPLYFLIVLLAFFVFPNIPFFVPPNNERLYFDINFYRRLSLFGIVLPNMGFILYNSPYLCAQVWSIGVEEQFYYIWPWVVKKFTLLRLFMVLTVFTLITVAIFVFYIYVVGGVRLTLPEIIINFFGQFRILTLATGGGFAMLLYHRKQRALNLLFRRDVQAVVYATLAVCLLTGVHINGFHLEFYGLFFGFLILNVAANPRSIINLEFGWVSYLGKISYGIYIYQTAMIVCCAHFILWVFGRSLPLYAFNLLLYPASALLTVLVSGLSFSYFEKPFLRYKERFNQLARRAAEV